MPWREICPMEEKTRFIAAVLAAEESMTVLCAEFGISRKTGYKWLMRYHERGPGGLYALSRAPQRVPWAISDAQVAKVAVAANDLWCIDFKGWFRCRYRKPRPG